MEICSIKGCEKEVNCRGLCKGHYEHKRKTKANAVCCIKECDKQVLARDMCAMHYNRLKKYGSPMQTKTLQYHGLSAKDRLMKRVKKSGDCWLYPYSINHKGYGMISFESVPRLAHRVSWIVHKGPIPKGLYVLHRCDTPLCVRPDHLFLGTHAVNMADMVRKGRHNPGHVIGNQVGTAKLTEVQAKSILQSKMPGVFLARKFNISATQISSIRNRKSWRHLD